MSCTLTIFAQKVIEKSWDADSFSKIEIQSNEVFKIVLISDKTNRITLSTSIEGEHYESLNIGASEVDDVLILKPSYRPYFKPKNDKLAAHKVISIEMTLNIPKHLEVFVNARIASLLTNGAFQKLDVNLRDGQCQLINFKGNATINTHQGDIVIQAEKDVSGTGLSKYGNVENKLAKIGKYYIKAESVNGNISLLYREK